MRVFLDIGAHEGETLMVAKDRRWQFDEIHCFEPAIECMPALEELSEDARVRVHPFGLSDRTADLPLGNPGSVSASQIVDRAGTTNTSMCHFEDVSAWLEAHVSPHDEIWMKVNAEGAEADLVARMSEKGVLSWVDHLMIHFDVRKMPQVSHREGPTRELLQRSGIEWIDARCIQFGVVGRGTANWLMWTMYQGPFRDLRYKRVSNWEFAARRRLYPLKQYLQRRSST